MSRKILTETILEDFLECVDVLETAEVTIKVTISRGYDRPREVVIDVSDRYGEILAVHGEYVGDALLALDTTMLEWYEDQ